jgi:drug/metabolite transporter (DMT)-like permease
LALGSAAAIAATFVVRKSVSETVNPATFSVWWYGLAGLYAWTFALIRGKVHGARGIRTGWKPMLGLVLLNAAGAILYFLEIDLTNPALVSFFGRLRTVYTVLLGVVFLRERLNGQEWVGAAVTVLGTLLIAYRGGAVLNLVFLLALVENLLMAGATIMAKFAVHHIPPIVLAGYRGVLISLVILVYALLTGQWEWVEGRTLVIVATGALSGPFLGYVMHYASLARVDAGKAAIVAAIQPAFVTLYTVFLFGDLPTFQQALGGALTIVGVAVVFAARNVSKMHERDDGIEGGTQGRREAEAQGSERGAQRRNEAEAEEDCGQNARGKGVE